ncbi:hypothetical protein E3N88_24259 [Mikania micrantha]|uniref:PHD-type domain-containing protein n=1 Tax=Mikania micrantha TaxID=192012 RepID=A0A5N6NIB1_9ASTR|nr:hypothetical protein E3N88_24259 [Mikania micrantha]
MDGGPITSRDRGIRSLTRTEWEDMQKKGLCFWCGQQYGPTHKCPEGKLRVLLLGEGELSPREGDHLLLEADDSPEQPDTNLTAIHDWQNAWMKFTKEDTSVTLQGMDTSCSSKFPLTQWLSLEETSSRPISSLLISEQQSALSLLLTDFASIFLAPSGLPPHRSHDHCILLHSTVPICVRPHRYLFVQKAETECQPIPVVEELLDELHGAKFVLKLDLKSGYNQTRMSEDIIERTAFRTHDGHYEYLVMPFGLTNTPATFEAIMNDIFHPLLHRNKMPTMTFIESDATESPKKLTRKKMAMWHITGGTSNDVKQSAMQMQSLKWQEALWCFLYTAAPFKMHDFLCCFKEVIGIQEPISFQELEQELLCPCAYGIGKSSFLHTFETFLHSVLLPELVSKLLGRLSSVVNSKLGVKIQLAMLPINELTWPEVVRRYIMAYLLMGGRFSSSKIVDSNRAKLIHCLQSDCGIFCGSATNVAGIDLDAQCKKRTIHGHQGGSSDGCIPEWAKVLDPVKKLPTNVGSRIRNCVYEALKKIHLNGQRSNWKLQSRKTFTRAMHLGPLSKRDFSILMGNNLKCDEIKVLFELASRRPLDFPTVDLRLLHNTYFGSPHAFLEDVKELWINLKKTHMNTSSLVKLVDDMSKDFNLQYENEVAPLLRKLSEYHMNGNFNAEVEKELEQLLASIEIPKMSLEAGICKVCGINKDDDKVLLCDSEWCNAEYHTYCLNPPLSIIPQGNWYCPACNTLVVDQPKGTLQILQFVDKSCREEADQFLDMLTALEETEYWQLEAHKKIFLLKFLIDKSLDTNIIRKNLGEIKKKSGKEFLGIDSFGRIYWVFPYISSNCGIVVNLLGKTDLNPFDHPTNHSPYDNGDQWYLFQTDEEINKLVDYLTSSDPYQKELNDSILVWWKIISQSGQHTEWNKSAGMERVYSKHLNKFPYHSYFSTNAIVLLEGQYGSSMEPDKANCKKPSGKNMTKWHRQLVINLLDMEAALPDGAKRRSMASPEWRSRWCAFVKSANTLHEIVEATLALETMIKSEYINNTWWWYWSSVSAAAKTSTIAALALRIYTLDAAIKPGLVGAVMSHDIYMSSGSDIEGNKLHDHQIQQFSEGFAAVGRWAKFRKMHIGHLKAINYEILREIGERACAEKWIGKDSLW